MKVFEKELLRVATYFIPKPDGKWQVFSCGADDLRWFHDQGNLMLSRNISIPLPLEHQREAVPMTPAEKLAANVLYNGGWVKDFFFKKDGSLWFRAEIDPSEHVARRFGVSKDELENKLESTIRFVSPWIKPEFRSGDGQTWRNCITHVALTNSPIWSGQKPFSFPGSPSSMEAALSLCCQDGICFSLANAEMPISEKEEKHGDAIVRFVNAKAIRDSSLTHEEFGDLGTHVEFPDMIPKGEVWVSDTVHDDDKQITIDTGLAQLKADERGESKDKAVAHGIAVGKHERQKHAGKKSKPKKVPKEVYIRPWVAKPGVRLSGELESLLKGVSVFIVDTHKVRDEYQTAFVEGSNHEAEGFVPDNEIWISDEVVEEEIPNVVKHEAVERKLMKGGMKYPEAHKEASKAEFADRKDSDPRVAVKNRPRVLAVDFDGTVGQDNSHLPIAEIKPRKGAAKNLSKLKKLGAHLVMWTCRPEAEEELGKWMDANGIPYDEINKSAYDKLNSRKLLADRYIDDRAINAKNRSWDDIFEEASECLFGEAHQPVSSDAGYEKLAPLAVKAHGETRELLPKLFPSLPMFEVEDSKIGELEAELSKPGALIVMAPIKCKKRSEEKVNADYEGDWRKLLDIVRAAVVFDSMKELREAADQFTSTVNLARAPVDKFEEPQADGYRDYVTSVRLPSGMIAEVQFNLKKMFIAREKERMAYSVARIIRSDMEKDGRASLTFTEKEAIDRAEEDAKEIFAKAWDESVKMSLDRLGGEMPSVSKAKLKEADFITYPEDVKGSNCGNCMFNREGICRHHDLDGQSVSKRNCCGYWNAPGTLREWKGRDGEVYMSHNGRSYACAMIPVSDAVAAAVRDFGLRIPDTELAEDGREDKVHVTLKYGLEDSAKKKLQKALGDVYQFPITVGGASLFRNPNYDVLKLEILSPELMALNGRVDGQVPHIDTYDFYSPHVTVAYLKPGFGHKYVGPIPGLTGAVFTATKVDFSDTKDKHTEINLKSDWEHPPTCVCSQCDEAKIAARDMDDYDNAKSYADELNSSNSSYVGDMGLVYSDLSDSSWDIWKNPGTKRWHTIPALYMPSPSGIGMSRERHEWEHMGTSRSGLPKWKSKGSGRLVYQYHDPNEGHVGPEEMSEAKLKHVEDPSIQDRLSRSVREQTRTANMSAVHEASGHVLEKEPPEGKTHLEALKEHLGDSQENVHKFLTASSALNKAQLRELGQKIGVDYLPMAARGTFNPEGKSTGMLASLHAHLTGGAHAPGTVRKSSRKPREIAEQAVGEARKKPENALNIIKSHFEKMTPEERKALESEVLAGGKTVDDLIQHLGAKVQKKSAPTEKPAGNLKSDSFPAQEKPVDEENDTSQDAAMLAKAKEIGKRVADKDSSKAEPPWSRPDHPWKVMMSGTMMGQNKSREEAEAYAAELRRMTGRPANVEGPGTNEPVASASWKSRTEPALAPSPSSPEVAAVKPEHVKALTDFVSKTPHNFAKMHEVRAALEKAGVVDAGQQDAVIQRARKDGLVSAGNIEGREGISPEEKSSALREKNAPVGEMLGHLIMRTPQPGAIKLNAAQMQAIAGALSAGSLEQYLSKLRASGLPEAGAAEDFARRIDKLWKKKDGFVPQQVRDLIKKEAENSATKTDLSTDPLEETRKKWMDVKEGEIENDEPPMLKEKPEEEAVPTRRPGREGTLEKWMAEEAEKFSTMPLEEFYKEQGSTGNVIQALLVAAEAGVPIPKRYMKFFMKKATPLHKKQMESFMEKSMSHSGTCSCGSDKLTEVTMSKQDQMAEKPKKPDEEKKPDDMAEKPDEKPGEKKPDAPVDEDKNLFDDYDDPEVPPGAPGSSDTSGIVGDAIQALAAHGIAIKQEPTMTSDDLVKHLTIALRALSGVLEPKGNETPGAPSPNVDTGKVEAEKPSSVIMSQTIATPPAVNTPAPEPTVSKAEYDRVSKKLASMEMDKYTARLDRCVAAEVMSPAKAKEFKTKISGDGVMMSLATESPNVTFQVLDELLPILESQMTGKSKITDPPLTQASNTDVALSQNSDGNQIVAVPRSGSSVWAAIENNAEKDKAVMEEFHRNVGLKTAKKS